MVLVALDHVRDALDPLRPIPVVVAELVVEGVRLDVRLVHHVQAVPVTELEPVGVVRIVRRPDRIHVRALHQRDVRLHRSPRQRAAAAVVVLVPIDAGDHHGNAVHEQLPVANLDRAEADVARHRLAAGVDLEPVERGVLRRPRTRATEHAALCLEGVLANGTMPAAP